MHPAKLKKVDISKLTEEEQKLFRLYGKLPSHKNILTKVQKDRKYFDSGDYALSKAGVGPQNAVGTAIPNPENIPHASLHATHQLLSSSPVNSATSPVRESVLAQSETTQPDDHEQSFPPSAESVASASASASASPQK
ncbi:camp-regulated phosphoprotein/endosulfine conserved region-domain-containing protein [Russula compacta]|nr:camp-regulated phosphoprotein/endosulfine conserved region-domain-containing protein [Russula compacta]